MWLARLLIAISGPLGPFRGAAALPRQARLDPLLSQQPPAPKLPSCDVRSRAEADPAGEGTLQDEDIMDVAEETGDTNMQGTGRLRPGGADTSGSTQY